MLPVAVIHVPVSSSDGKRNLDIGLTHGVWGWNDSVWSKPKAHASISSLVVGQPLLLVLGGPNPRTDAWASGMTPFQRVATCSITRSAYDGTVAVWPDGPYPHRIDITVHAVAESVPLDTVGADFWEPIRLSGCAQGAPYVSEVDWDLSDYAKLIVGFQSSFGPGTSPVVEVAKVLETLEDAAQLPDDLVIDKVVTTTARVEARYFRNRLLNGADSYACALCGRDLPRRLIVAAHIKKRSQCSDGERKDPNVVMGNCLLGCDILYEIGVVTVDPTGKIVQGKDDPFPGVTFSPTSSLGQATSSLIGRKCEAFGPKTKSYFAWHYEQNRKVNA